MGDMGDMGDMGEKRGVSRRVLLGGMLFVGASVATAGMQGRLSEQALGFAAEKERGSASGRGDAWAQYGFLVRVGKCINCGKCVEACRLWSRTPRHAESRRRLVDYRGKAGKESVVSISCMHCGKPSCKEVCPAGAIEKGKGGIVTVNKNRCIGCKYCYQACPFEIPHYDSSGMDKCDYCFGAGVALGEPPRCVRACKVGALNFGTMDELVGRSRRIQRIEGPTEPSYVLAK